MGYSLTITRDGASLSDTRGTVGGISMATTYFSKHVYHRYEKQNPSRR
jgi:hypothetical protein